MDRKSEEWKKLRAMSDEDYKKYQSPNLVKNVPEKFKKWCDTNKDKLNAAREKGKLPYFVRDNEKVVGEIVGWEEEKPTTKKAMSSREKILAAAKARHEARTDEQIADIKQRWTSIRILNRSTIYQDIVALREKDSTTDIKYNIGKGEVQVPKLVKTTDSDFKKLVQVAAFFAIDGAKVVLTPKMTRPPLFAYKEYYASLIGTKFEGKCPDILVYNKINGMETWYEHEGFVSKNPKNAFRNMLNDGLKQSNRLIIDKPNLTEAFMKRIINQRVKTGQDIKEVWVRNNNSIYLLYKKLEE